MARSVDLKALSELKEPADILDGVEEGMGLFGAGSSRAQYSLLLVTWLY